MDLNTQSSEYGRALQSNIVHYRLDFQQNGRHHCYIWRHHPPNGEDGRRVAILVDLNDIYMPDLEIEKMVCSFLLPATGAVSIAFANCHSHNQQEIKRKLKAGDIKLYSKTAFFVDILRARQWLETQCANG